ncbi:hypothetical protein [Streptomyces sp. NPDC004435]|uniref:RICIN domain-containing protein n=1 Tax=Streptomyces sp. NPDC004435 TaxID=3364701 RepID=UPI0036CCB1FF
MISRKIGALAATVIASVGMTATSATAATEATTAGATRIETKAAPGLCIGVIVQVGSGRGAEDVIRSCGASHSMMGWTVGGTSGGVRTFTHDEHRYCLDSNSSGSVYMHSCNGGNYQKWQQVYVAAGWKLKNVATGRYLQTNNGGNPISTGASSGSLNQSWGIWNY